MLRSVATTVAEQSSTGMPLTSLVPSQVNVGDGVAAHVHLVVGTGEETTGRAHEGLGRDEAEGGRHHGVVAPRGLSRAVLGQGFALVAGARLRPCTWCNSCRRRWRWPRRRLEHPN